MWNSVFDIGIPVLEKVIRPLLIYLFLIIALRVSGKRELGQLNMLDFVVLLAVANAVQNGIIGNDISVTGVLIGAAVLFTINWVAAEISLRSPRLRHLIIGTPALLVTDGKINRARLRQELLTEDDITAAVIDAGGTAVNDAAKIILEPNGRLVVELKRDLTVGLQLKAITERLDLISKQLDNRNS